jgi:penicillin-binding protein-related factor A (putative recombinase)
VKRSAKLDKGKGLEKRIKFWLDNLGYFNLRLFDARSVGGMTARQPADFLTFRGGHLYFLECKEINGKRLPISHLTQIKILHGLKSFYDISSYFIIKYKGDEMYMIDTTVLYDWVTKNMNKFRSISIETAQSLGHRIRGREDLATYLLGVKD